MSSSGTPACSPTSSAPSSHESDTEIILTPNQKLQALLAQFEDSDSDASAPGETTKDGKATTTATKRGRPATTTSLLQQSESEDDDEDALPFANRGRLMAKPDRRDSRVESEDHTATADIAPRDEEPLSQPRRDTDIAATKSSDDELSRPAPRRRLLLKRKSSPSPAEYQPSRDFRSVSPLFFPLTPNRRISPAPDSDEVQSDSDDLPEQPQQEGKNKFLALVEKHRKQRLAKEAADIAKKAARLDKLKELSKKSGAQHGSSIADDSDNDTDTSGDEAGAKLTQQARPTRKASKKAIEEMNRETQRMSRNMQLEHQARTKKRITKDSLLALFNFPTSGAASPQAFNTGLKSTTASSAPTSDAEATKKHTTPPTSPLTEETFEKIAPAFITPPEEVVDVLMVLAQDDDALPDMLDVMTQPMPKLDNGKGKAIDPEESSLPKEQGPIAVRPVRPIRVRWTKEDAVMARAADSDSDLEIITSKAKTRKYAVFESVPLRKAHETQSHLALRNLAHVSSHMNSNDKKSSMNAAEMELSLRRAARLQAQREREEKIDELKAKGVVIQTAEERERDQREVEDIVERARQEAADIQKREKEASKKDGTYVKDGLDDDDDDEEDGDFQGEDDAFDGTDDQEGQEEDEDEDDEDEEEDEESDDEEVGRAELENENGVLVDDAAQEDSEISEQEDRHLSDDDMESDEQVEDFQKVNHKPRQSRIILDDEEEDAENANIASPPLPAPVKTPQSLASARKAIPGLQMSDELPMGLTQAFAATMADSQTQEPTQATQAEDSLTMIRDLPSPRLAFVPLLQHLDSIDVVSDSQPASQTQPLDLDLSLDQSQRVPQSPATGLGISGTPASQIPFEPTQDAGYMLSPFMGSRFAADTPSQRPPQSTIETVILQNGGDESPIVQRKSRLKRGRADTTLSDDDDFPVEAERNPSAFTVKRKAAKQRAAEAVFDKTKSEAKQVIDEAAEESEDEYAGLGGASDDEAGEEDEDDRQMIDHDTQVGRGDEAKLAGLFADRERQQDEAAVSKLLKDITTGALRRKRAVGDDLDLSDEEDEAARRREAKRREFAKMRRELLKDEAVGKIAEDRKKEAFLKSIEDRDDVDEDDDDFDPEATRQDVSQSQTPQNLEFQDLEGMVDSDEIQNSTTTGQKRKRPLESATESSLNRLPPSLCRTAVRFGTNKKPATLAEIRESVSFLIEEPDSQSATIDLGLSDSEDEPEKYLDLDRHLKAVDENIEDDEDDLGDFIVEDSQNEGFKIPNLPQPKRASYTERRTKNRNVVDRLSLSRQSSSSSSSSNAGGKMAFYTSASALADTQFGKVPSLLRRATTNSSLGSMAGRDENMSATGVTVAKERGSVGEEKTFVRKGSGGQRNAVNYRIKLSDNSMSERAGVKKAITGKRGKGNKGGFLGGLFRGDSFS